MEQTGMQLYHNQMCVCVCVFLAAHMAAVCPVLWRSYECLQKEADVRVTFGVCGRRSSWEGGGEKGQKYKDGEPECVCVCARL